MLYSINIENKGNAVTEVGVGQLAPYGIGVNRNNKNQEKAIILVPETNQKQNSVYPNFDFDHIVGGDISKNGKKVTGGHSLVKGDVSIKEIIGKADSKGVYKANIRIYNSQKGEWQDKKATTTMFPSSWNENKIKEEIKGAWNSNDFESKITSRGMEWRGTSPSGIKIEGFINSDRTIAYPQYRGDK